MRIALVVVALGIAAALAPRSVAAQQNTGVVLSFPGWRGAQARAQVVRELEGRAGLVNRSDAESTARDAGVSLDEPSGMARVAQQLGLKFIVTGRVRGRGGRARTEIQIYDASGTQIATQEGPRPQGTARMRQIRQAAGAAYDQASAAIAEADAAAAAAAEAAAQQQQQDQDMAFGLDGEQPPDEDEEAADSPLPLIAAYLGLDIRKRKADLTLPVPPNRQYRAGFYPELTLTVQSFPLRGMDNEALRGIYAQLDFAVSLGLTSQELDAAGNPGPELDTTAWRLGIHVGYLYSLMNDMLRFGGMLGFGTDVFNIDENGTITSSAYPFMRLGVAADVRLYEELLRARLDFGFRIVFNSGDFVPAFGEDSKQLGFDLGVALMGALEMGVSYGLRFGFTKYSVDFSGLGAPTTEVPAGATSEDLTDVGINLGLMVGYTL